MSIDAAARRQRCKKSETEGEKVVASAEPQEPLLLDALSLFSLLPALLLRRRSLRQASKIAWKYLV